MSGVSSSTGAAPAPLTPAYCTLPDPTKKPNEKLLDPGDGSSLPVGHFRGRHLLSIGDLTRAEIDRLMRVADYMAQVVAGPGITNLAAGCIAASVFYEPSTRTSSSFQAAMMRLGGQVLSISDVANSSVAKGETLEDTMQCLQCYANIVVLRHPETGSARRAASVLNVPLVNAGDGIGEHPTQALLDLYTLHGEFGRIDGLTVTMVGDLKNGRTVHSLAKLLLHFSDCTLHFVSPPSLAMPESVLKLLDEKKVKYTQSNQLNEVMQHTDVLYGQAHLHSVIDRRVLQLITDRPELTKSCTLFDPAPFSSVTRVQKERFGSLGDYDSVKDDFLITPALLSELRARDSMRILHPMPRVNELHADIDADPRAAYFRQMKHGLHVRMAILACLLGKA